MCILKLQQHEETLARVEEAEEDNVPAGETDNRNTTMAEQDESLKARGCMYKPTSKH